MSYLDTRISRRTVLAGTAVAGAATFAGARVFGLAVMAQDEPEAYEAPENIGDIEASFESDGSSTLGPLTEAAIEEFAAIAPNIQITNGISGTGGGFERFAKGEIAIANASRPIKDEEAAAAAAAGISWYKFDVAYDGITVVVSAENDFVDSLTVDELASIWAADGGVTTWADVNPDWPAEPIELYGPGTASGTFDYINEEILGEEREPRTDYTPSEDDNVLVQGIAGSPYALGYFGFSYYEENADSLKALAIDGVEPTIESISDGSYTPLGRVLYIYVSAAELTGNEAVAEFVKFYVATANELAESVGYIALPGADEAAQQQKLFGALDGSVAPDSDTFGAEATPAA